MLYCCRKMNYGERMWHLESPYYQRQTAPNRGYLLNALRRKWKRTKRLETRIGISKQSGKSV